jgi:hypothetical protein
MKVTVPEDHQLEIRLPPDFPAGPAEIIVLAASSIEGAQRRDSGELLAALESLRSMKRTEDEERVLEDFDRFRQANPFDLASLVDKDQ